MKKLILRQFLLFSFCLLTSDFLLHAQSPQGIPYQAIARNSSGQAIANTAVRVRFSIRDSIATGTVRYQETHNPTTSALGLFSVNVGMGTVVSGTFSGINWGKNAKFLKVELDPAGGTTYNDLGTTQMMSVPYALNAGNGLSNGTAQGQMMYWNGSAWVTVSPGTQGQNLTFCNGVPTWGPCPVMDNDGNSYNIVTIGSQVWMKENLKVSKYRNGDAIPTGLADATWQNTTSGAYAIYNNLAANNTTYGKLYNWYAVADPRGLCPAGWHMPSDHDWNLLTKYLNPAADTSCNGCYNNTAGGKMKSTGTIGAGTGLWNTPNTDASNSSGLTCLPGGTRLNSGSYSSIGSYGAWWSSSEYSSSYAWYRGLGYDNGSSFRNIDFTKTVGFSVRCLRD